MVRLTEDEVRKLDAEVFADGNADPKDELTWATKTLENFRAELNALKGQYALYKHVRNDEGMSTTKDAILSIRAMVNYLQRRIEELQ